MSISIVPKAIEIRIVHRFPFYFYNRIGNGDDRVQSISGTEAKRIYEVNQDAERQDANGQPEFDNGPEPWEWTVWVVEEEE
jgi:hypothetical protein